MEVRKKMKEGVDVNGAKMSMSLMEIIATIKNVGEIGLRLTWLWCCPRRTIPTVYIQKSTGCVNQV